MEDEAFAEGVDDHYAMHRQRGAYVGIALYGGGKGLNFSERIGSYRESLVKNGRRHIEINVKNDEDSYLYVIDVFDNGHSDIEVQAQQCERISYSGEMVFE